MFAIRSLIATKDGRQLRIIDVLQEQREVVLIDIKDSKAQPVLRSFEDFHELLESKQWSAIRVAADAAKAIAKAIPIALTDYAKELRSTRWSLVEPLLRNPDLYRRQTRQLVLDSAAAGAGVSVVHLRTLLRMAWQGGMTPEAVTPDMYNCGRQAFDGKPRGRKPTHAEYEPYCWTKELHGKCTAFVRKAYSSDSTVTLQEVYDRLVLKHFSYIDADGVVQQLEAGQRPSVRQIRTLIDTQLTDSERLIGRHGQAAYDNEWKPTIGHIAQDCLGAGDVYEIDASQVDCWLVSREDGKTIIGKATMYLVVDRFSRLIVGFYVSLDKESWAGAQQAILSIFRDKRELCRENGVEYRERDWVAHGLMPNRFFGDRGPMVSLGSDAIADGLHTTVTNARSLWSAGKGLVECAFKLVHVPMKALKAGYEPARNTKIRRGRKYFRDAKLTIVDLRRELLRCVLEHNRKVHTTYELPAKDIRAGHKAIPLEVFARSQREHMGLMTEFAEQDVRLRLLTADTATVTQDGIRFGHCYYDCAWAHERDWYTRARVRGHFPVNICHNPGLVDDIYIFDPNDPTNYTKASLTDFSSQYVNYTRAEVESLKGDEKANVHEGKEHNLTQRLNKLAADDKSGLSKPTGRAVKSKVHGPAMRAADTLHDRATTQALPDAPEPAPVVATRQASPARQGRRASLTLVSATAAQPPSSTPAPASAVGPVEAVPPAAPQISTNEQPKGSRAAVFANLLEDADDVLA